MDFSAFNPLSSNSLNLAARSNDIGNVKRLLKKNNPNCEDNRGWTCLHEAAANNSYESLLLIMKHPDCRLLAETFEGHTALYLACRENSSLETIKVLLENSEDIINYASTEMVSPLHVACGRGRLELVEMLINHGAILDVQDFDGDTPMHDAAFQMHSEIVTTLLHAGANPNIKNEALYSSFHLACFKGNLKTVTVLHPFVCDINETAYNGETPLILAAQSGSAEVIQYLLQNNADPHVRNGDNELALNTALINGNSEAFKLLLAATNRDQINENIIITACKPHYFKMDIIITLLESDLGPEFFNSTEQFYVTLEKIGDIQPCYIKNAPLNSFLHISEYIYNHCKDLFVKLLYLFLMRGVSVNALYTDECPPIVYIHYCPHSNCFEEVLRILLEHGCDIDYKTCSIPDVFVAALGTGGSTITSLIPYSITCEPLALLKLAYDASILERIPNHVQATICAIVDIYSMGLITENIPCFVPALKHLARLKIRHIVRKKGPYTSRQFLKIVDRIPLPSILQLFLRYMS